MGTPKRENLMPIDNISRSASRELRKIGRIASSANPRLSDCPTRSHTSRGRAIFQDLRKSSEQGFSMVETLMATGFVLAIIFILGNSARAYFDILRASKAAGEVVDIRTYILNSLDCPATVTANTALCAGRPQASPAPGVSLRNANATVIQDTNASNRIAGTYHIRTSCFEIPTPAFSFHIEYAAEHKRDASNQLVWKSLTAFDQDCTVGGPFPGVIGPYPSGTCNGGGFVGTINCCTSHFNATQEYCWAPPNPDPGNHPGGPCAPGSRIACVSL